MTSATATLVGARPGKATERWRGLAAGLILVAGDCAIYGRTLHDPFLLDDHSSILRNASIRHLDSLAVFSPPAGAGVSGRPLLNLTFALNYAWGGESVVGYHAVNLAVHALATLALMALVGRALSKISFGPGGLSGIAPWVPPLVAALWSWHPVQTEVVTYLSQRAEGLASLCFLGTVLAFAKGAEGRPRSHLWLGLSALSCLAGVLVKQIVVTAPVAVLLYDWVFLGGSLRAILRRRAAYYAVLAAACAPVFWLSVAHPTGFGFQGGVSPTGYFLQECRAVTTYLRLAAFPRPLIFDYTPRMTASFCEAWPCAALLLALGGAAAMLVAQRRASGYAWAWFFLILAPTSSFIPIYGQSIAESRMYLPLAGVLAWVGIGGAQALGRSSLVLLGAAAVVLAGLSYQRNACYNDEIGLWRDTVAKAPDNPRALVNLALALLQQPEGRASAVAALERALALSPDDVEAVYNLAYCQMLEGRTREAIRGFERAERLRPAYPGVHQALGTLDAQTPGREALAAEEFAAWVRLSPDDPGAHYALGTALAQSGSRLDAAESAFRSALRLDPTFANAHLNLGNLLAARPGRLGEAIDQYQQAIEIDPKLTLAHFNLAMALLSARRLPEAERQLQTVLRLQPDNRLARRYLDRVERLQGRDP